MDLTFVIGNLLSCFELLPLNYLYFEFYLVEINILSCAFNYSVLWHELCNQYHRHYLLNTEEIVEFTGIFENLSESTHLDIKMVGTDQKN